MIRTLGPRIPLNDLSTLNGMLKEMLMAKVAFMTIGLLHAPYGDPRVQGFFDRGDANFATAEASPGFMGRSQYDEATEADTWGASTQPALFNSEAYLDRTPQTLSVWHDLESVFAFAYSSVHDEALSKRKEWFVHPEWPSYVAWWVDDAHTPSWQEAYERYEQLRRDGSSPNAFDFKRPFEPDGHPITIDRAVVKRITQRTTEDRSKGTPRRDGIDAIIGTYLAAWSEPNPMMRRQLLKAIWDEAGTYTDPLTHAATFDELDAVIAQFLTENAGARFSISGKIDYHHGHVRFNWLLHVGNSVEVAGGDYGEVAPNGKLTKIVGFF